MWSRRGWGKDTLAEIVQNVFKNADAGPIHQRPILRVAISENGRNCEGNDIKRDVHKDICEPGGHVKRMYGGRWREICSIQDGELRIPVMGEGTEILGGERDDILYHRRRGMRDETKPHDGGEGIINR